MWYFVINRCRCISLRGLVVFALLVMPIVGYSQAIPEDTAIRYAEAFLTTQSKSSAAQTTKNITAIKDPSSRSPEMYLITMHQGGWVLLSGEEKVQPVLAYSTDGYIDLDSIPDAFQYFLDYYTNSIIAARTNRCADMHPTWRQFLESGITETSTVIVSPLLVRNGSAVAWKQSGNANGNNSVPSKSYNKFCPAGPTCEHTKVGCVAVAMGQILWYWKWPDVVAVETDNGDHVVRHYDWNAMPTKLSNLTPAYNVNNVANLLHDCGVFVNMVYGCDISGIADTAMENNVQSAYANYWYESQYFKRKDYTNDNWLLMLKNELNNNRPIFYSGKSSTIGHAFVLDGYDSADRFHVNLGSGSVSNEYFLLDSISGSSVIYSDGQEAAFAYPNVICSPFVLSDTLLNEDFVITQGDEITFNDVVIEGPINGLVRSNTSITLNPGTEIKSNTNVILEIVDLPCNSGNNILVTRNVTKRNQDFQYADKWKVLTDCRMNFDVDWVEKNFHIVKDTIIGRYTYQLLNNKKCIRYSDDGMQFYYLGDSAEYLLCDYSLEVGDTCYAYMGDLMFDNMEQILLNAGYKLVQPWIVKSKDIIDQRIHIKMSCTYGVWDNKAYEYETEMIQGIGSRHFIFPFVTSAWFIGGAPSYTLCAFHNDENIYSFDLTKQGIVNNCPQWSAIADDVISMRTQPTVKKMIKDGQVFIQKDGRIFNSLGQEMTVEVADENNTDYH